MRAQIDRAPLSPGVYIFRGEGKKILYVGKAIRLRDRLKAYVPPVKDERPSVLLLVPQIREVEWLITDTEKEAILLENSLIKTHRPRYNISLRDDKSYVSLRLTKHAHPRLFVTRNIVRDGSEYFGPYSSAAGVRQTLKLIQQLFRVRDCTDSFYSQRSRPCMRYEIKRCTAPCVALVTPEAYAEQVRQACLFLIGQKDELVARLRKEMEEASEGTRFEEAALLRDRLADVEGTLEPQEVESRSDERDADAIGLSGDADATLIKVLKIRKGRLIAADEFLTEEPVGSSSEIVRAFFQEYYLADYPGHEIPPQLLLPIDVDDQSSFETLFAERAGHKVTLFVPKRGAAQRLLVLAERNAASAFGERKRKTEKNQRAMSELQFKLKLPRLPKRIEGYDISNLQGAEAVGSMIVFVDGEPDKTKYRQFNIRSVKVPDDFAMLREMFERRFRKMSAENRPDLILVDGGRGQLRQATEALREAGMTDLPIASIAKEREAQPDRIFLPGQKNPILFPRSSPVLHLLQGVRDEAHRFGITRHRRARSRATIGSVLNRIPGIGPKRQRALLRAFGSVDEISRAPLEELTKISGITAAAAQSIAKFFAKTEAPGEE
ncbi:MAG: excinuclease ABC subunit UvrC [Pseudomonadota bacterium]